MYPLVSRRRNSVLNRENAVRAIRWGYRTGKAVKDYLRKRKRSKQLDKSKSGKGKKVRKSHPDTVHTDTLHTGISSDTIRIKRPGSSRLKLRKGNKLVPGKWMVQYNQSQILANIAGLQNVVELIMFGTVSQFIRSNTPYAYNAAPLALADMNPYDTNTGSVIVPSQADPLTDRFIFSKAELKLELTNFCGVGTIIDAYLVTPRIITSTTPTSAWNTGLTADEGFGKPVMTFPAAGVTTGGVPGSIS